LGNIPSSTNKYVHMWINNLRVLCTWTSASEELSNNDNIKYLPGVITVITDQESQQSEGHSVTTQTVHMLKNGVLFHSSIITTPLLCKHKNPPRTYFLTYLLTPYSRVLLEKLTGLQLLKNFPRFYGTRRIITAFTSSRHLSLSRASSIQSQLPHLTSWRFITLSSQIRLGLPSGLLHLGLPDTCPYPKPPRSSPHPHIPIPKDLS
jgi:hypothetical protein